MHDLITKLVPEEQRSSALLLSEDDYTRMLVYQQLSQLAEDEAGIIPQKSYDWVLCKLTMFGAGETDTLRVYSAFCSQLAQKATMCRQLSTTLVFDKPEVVADRITIGLGIFLEHAQMMHRRRGAPSPRYYQGLAETCYRQTGYETLADDLDGWLKFLQDNFALKL